MMRYIFTQHLSNEELSGQLPYSYLFMIHTLLTEETFLQKNASELLGNPEEMFPLYYNYTYIVISLACSYLQPHT